MRKLRVLLICHEDLVPPEYLPDPDQVYPWHAEFCVREGLRELGHDFRVLGLSDDVLPIRETVESWKPHVVFNQLVELRNVGAFAVHVVGYLELLDARYTGCNPRGLTLARDKALTKKILRYHRIPTPGFVAFPRGRAPRLPRRLPYPMIVKALDEEASRGVSQASIVHDDDALLERVDFVHRHVGSAIAEQYVEGRELTVGILGNERLTVFPAWELSFAKLPDGTQPIATERVKWNRAYQKKLGITTGPADVPDEVQARIARLARRTFRALNLSGYARLDLRLSEDGRIHVIEANPNPDLTDDEDFSMAAERAGLDYPELIQRIVNLGRRYRGPGHEA